MKILLVGDVHISTYSSILRNRADKYSVRLEGILKTLNWIEETAIKENCDCEIFLGDTFDKPELNDEIITAIKDIKWNNIAKFFLVGNHESSKGNLAFNSVKVFEGHNRFIISNLEATITDNKTEVVFLPYITETNRKPLVDYLKNHTYEQRIIVSHNDIAGIQMGPVISKTGFSLEEITENCDLFINGHLHNGQWLIPDRVRNLGNITGQNFGEDARKYPHNIMILDTDTMTYKDIENPYAFNFYKIEINQESDLDLLSDLKDNAVLSIVCRAELSKKLEDVLNSQLKKILEHRISLTVDSSNVATELDVSELRGDHKQKFIEFCYEKFSNTEILQQELAIICRGD